MRAGDWNELDCRIRTGIGNHASGYAENPVVHATQAKIVVLLTVYEALETRSAKESVFNRLTPSGVP
jgi:hypothetical protein